MPRSTKRRPGKPVSIIALAHALLGAAPYVRHVDFLLPCDKLLNLMVFSRLEGLWRSSARYAKFEFYFEVQDGDKRIINDNKGKYYTLTVDGVPGYWSTGTTRYSPHAPCV